MYRLSAALVVGIVSVSIPAMGQTIPDVQVDSSPYGTYSCVQQANPGSYGPGISMAQAWFGGQDWAVFIRESSGSQVTGESPTNAGTMAISDSSVQEPTATAASANYVVFVDNAPNRVLVRDLQAPGATTLDSGGPFFRPAIGGAHVAWEVEIAGSREIRGRMINSGTNQNIGAGSWPTVADSKVYFEDSNHIMRFDLSTGIRDTLVLGTANRALHRPSAAGGILAYEVEVPLTGDSVIERFDLSTTTSTQISTSLCANAYQPRVGGASGAIVVYMGDNCVLFQDSSGNWHGGAGQLQLFVSTWDSGTSTATTYFLGEFTDMPDPDRQPWYDIEADRIAYTLDGSAVQVVNLL